MSAVSNKLPNLENLKLLNDLLEELESLKQAIVKTVEEKKQLDVRLAQEAKDFATKAENEAKKRITLEFIENKIIELRSQERLLAIDIEKTLEKAISKYIESDKFVDFLAKVIKQLNSQKTEFAVFASKKTSGYLPKNISYQEVAGDDLLRIETTQKVYIFDLDELKSQLKNNLLKNNLQLNS